jgi:hypothetical protein
MIESTDKKTCLICKSEKASVSRRGDSGLFLVNCRECGVAFRADHDVKDQFDRYLRNKWERDELKRIIAAKNDRDEFPRITSKFLTKLFGEERNIFDKG